MEQSTGIQNIVESFETSRTGVFGDMVNQPQKKKLKVGVYTAGWFEFWRMYPKLEEYAKKDMTVVMGQTESNTVIKECQVNAIFQFCCPLGKNIFVTFDPVAVKT